MITLFVPGYRPYFHRTQSDTTTTAKHQTPSSHCPDPSPNAPRSPLSVIIKAGATSAGITALGNPLDVLKARRQADMALPKQFTQLYYGSGALFLNLMIYFTALNSVKEAISHHHLSAPVSTAVIAAATTSICHPLDFFRINSQLSDNEHTTRKQDPNHSFRNVIKTLKHQPSLVSRGLFTTFSREYFYIGMLVYGGPILCERMIPEHWNHRFPTITALGASTGAAMCFGALTGPFDRLNTRLKDFQTHTKESSSRHIFQTSITAPFQHGIYNGFKDLFAGAGFRSVRIGVSGCVFFLSSKIFS